MVITCKLSLVNKSEAHADKCDRNNKAPTTPPPPRPRITLLCPTPVLETVGESDGGGGGGGGGGPEAKSGQRGRSPGSVALTSLAKWVGLTRFELQALV